MLETIVNIKGITSNKIQFCLDNGFEVVKYYEFLIKIHNEIRSQKSQGKAEFKFCKDNHYPNMNSFKKWFINNNMENLIEVKDMKSHYHMRFVLNNTYGMGLHNEYLHIHYTGCVDKEQLDKYFNEYIYHLINGIQYKFENKAKSLELLENEDLTLSMPHYY